MPTIYETIRSISEAAEENRSVSKQLDGLKFTVKQGKDKRYSVRLGHRAVIVSGIKIAEKAHEVKSHFQNAAIELSVWQDDCAQRILDCAKSEEVLLSGKKGKYEDAPISFSDVQNVPE